MRVLLYFIPIVFSWGFILKPHQRPPTRLESSSPGMWDVLSSALKEKARNWFISRAEKSGVEWTSITGNYIKELELLNNIYSQKNNRSIIYPDYYTRPFHGYDTGNLNWDAAVEGEAATLSMAVNYWKEADPLTTERWLRHNNTKNILTYIEETKSNRPNCVMDVGSSVGISTEYLYSSLVECDKMVGLDLSPYFVSLATYRSMRDNHPIEYVHQNAETPNLETKFDLIVCTFILHEVPREPSKKILEAMTNQLKEGGVLAIVDLDPTKVRNNLIVSTFRKWAFEVTEPHIYEYYQTNMSSLMEQSGLSQVKRVHNDPINCVWMGKKEISI